MADTWASDAEIIRRSSTGADYAGKDVAYKIHQLFGDSLTFDFSPYFSQADLVFVDGGHRYEVVSSDSANALRLVRPGGVVVWHDFANYGHYNDITRAILDALPADQLIQVENSQLALYQKPRSDAAWTRIIRNRVLPQPTLHRFTDPFRGLNAVRRVRLRREAIHFFPMINDISVGPLISRISIDDSTSARCWEGPCCRGRFAVGAALFSAGATFPSPGTKPGGCSSS
jgi:hypothetical protein